MGTKGEGPRVKVAARAPPVVNRKRTKNENARESEEDSRGTGSFEAQARPLSTPMGKSTGEGGGLCPKRAAGLSGIRVTQALPILAPAEEAGPLERGVHL